MKNKGILAQFLQSLHTLFDLILSLLGFEKAEKAAIPPAKDKSPYKLDQGTKLNKVPHNPIMKPNKDNWWESWQVFNPGVIMLDGTTHIFYRSIGEDGISRFGYANSKDGYSIERRLNYPVYAHEVRSGVYNFSPSGGSFGGCEDPRITAIEEDRKIYITYTACDGGIRVALSSINVSDFIKSKWKWARPKFISPEGEVHKNWVIFPEKINGRYAILHSIAPEIQIEYRDTLDFEDGDYIKSIYKNDDSREGMWDSWVRGVGPPPIKTKYGWLLIYHGMDKKNPSHYKVGAMLTDLTEPTKILHRSKTPIMEPDKVYENNGFKSGVVYVSGAVVKEDKLLVYYGASDSYICAASADLEKFLQTLINEEKVAFKIKMINKKP